MISPLSAKLARWCKWIVICAAGWTVVLSRVAHSTARFREHQRWVASQFEPEFESADEQLTNLRRDNDRLRAELAKLPELTGAAAQLQKELNPPAAPDTARWTAQSNALQTAIEQANADLADLGRWQRERFKADQIAAAQARLAEKAQDLSPENGGAERQYAELKETLGNLARARKRLMDIRNEWKELPPAEKDQFRPRLEEAQAQWAAANEKLGKDEVLYQGLPLPNTAQDPATVLLMRSVIPDQNGMSVSVYLDGTVKIMKESEAK